MRAACSKRGEKLVSDEITIYYEHLVKSSEAQIESSENAYLNT
jgi:hypothetical protein